MYTSACVIPSVYAGKKVLIQGECLSYYCCVIQLLFLFTNFNHAPSEESSAQLSPPPLEKELFSKWWGWSKPKLPEKGLFWRSCRCYDVQNTRLSYEDYFMAMAFLATARSKDMKYQVLVLPTDI